MITENVYIQSGRYYIKSDLMQDEKLITSFSFAGKMGT